MYNAYLGLGSNLGDRLENIRRAVAALGNVGGIVAVSSLYETEPAGFSSPHHFYNAAVHCRTSLGPVELLHQVKALERVLGRSASSHMKDREIDIDILLYEDLYYLDDHLEVPHPALAGRWFALAPPNEVAGGIIHPVFNETIARLLERCPAPAFHSKVAERITAAA